MRAVLTSFCAILCLAAAAAGHPAAAQSPPPAPEESASPSSSIDALYERLARARTEEEAKGIAGAIERAQLRSGSDTADLLMSRALTAIKGGKSDLAVELLSAIVTVSPDYAEAWNRRATLYFLKNDYVRAMADIAQTLKREPRHWGAWAGLGMILRDTGDKKRAYEAFNKALAINPHLETVKKAADDLREDVEGRDI